MRRPAGLAAARPCHVVYCVYAQSCNCAIPAPGSKAAKEMRGPWRVVEEEPRYEKTYDRDRCGEEDPAAGRRQDDHFAAHQTGPVGRAEGACGATPLPRQRRDPRSDREPLSAERAKGGGMSGSKPVRPKRRKA